MADDPSGILAAQEQAAQAHQRANQEQAVRVCLGALDPATRTDAGTYAEALRRLMAVCQEHLDRLETEKGP
jgi:hypothetical protein